MRVRVHLEQKHVANELVTWESLNTMEYEGSREFHLRLSKHVISKCSTETLKVLSSTSVTPESNIPQQQTDVLTTIPLPPPR